LWVELVLSYILINGISPLPKISSKTKESVNEYLEDLDEAYSFLYS